MEFADILGRVLFASVIAVIYIIVLAMFVRRLLGVAVGLGRIIIAGLLGLAAEVGFESRFVWKDPNAGIALLPVQIGIVLIVATMFLVLAELVFPTGTVVRPDKWFASLRARFARTRRYTEVTRIALSHGLLPAKRPNKGNTPAAAAERAAGGKSLRLALQDSGVTFVKFGQVLSTRAELLPAEYITELSKLQQSVPPEPWSEVRAMVDKELGQDVEPRLPNSTRRRWPRPPSGRSTARGCIRERRSPSRSSARASFPWSSATWTSPSAWRRTLEKSTEWGRSLGIVEVAEGFADALREELDYEIEAMNITALRTTQLRHPAAERVDIPLHYPELSTRRILVMQMVDGDTLSSPGTIEGHPIEERRLQAVALFRSLMHQIMDDGVFHADLHPGNIVLQPDGRIMLLDFGSVGRLDPDLRQLVSEVLLAFYRGDSRAIADALLDMAALPEDFDEAVLRRELSRFMSRYMGPGAAVKAEVFTLLVACWQNTASRFRPSWPGHSGPLRSWREPSGCWTRTSTSSPRPGNTARPASARCSAPAP